MQGASPEYGKAYAMEKSKPKKEEGSLWHLWEVFAVIVGAILSLEATAIWPVLYWPGVCVVWMGLLGIIVDAVRGKWHRHWLMRCVIAAIGITGIAYWTTGFVFAKASLRVDSKAGLNGSGVDLRIYLDNPSDYAFKDMELEIFVDGMMSQVSQLESVCQGLSFFPEANPMFVSMTDKATGRSTDIFPAGGSLSKKMRIKCGELPRHSVATLIIPVASTDVGNDPKNPFPQQFSAPARLPKWVTVKGDYRALGKTRDVDSSFSFNSK
jgi:hypothetical protein